MIFDDRVFAIENKHLDKLKNEKTTSQESLFHYTSTIGFKGIIENSCLWFTHINYLNDEEESLYTYKLLKEKCLIDLENKINKNLYEELNKISNTNSSNEDYFVSSFSTEKDNLSNWNYYTKSENATGYNLEFDKNSLIDSVDDTYAIYIHGKTIYKENIQKRMITELILDFNAVFEEINCNLDIVHHLNNVLKMYSLFFKHPSFSAENEYRIIIHRQRGLKFQRLDNDKFRIHNGIFIPYVERGFTINCVKSITISPTQKQLLVKNSVEKFLKEFRYNIQGNENFVKSSKIPLRY